MPPATLFPRTMPPMPRDMDGDRFELTEPAPFTLK